MRFIEKEGEINLVAGKIESKIELKDIRANKNYLVVKRVFDILAALVLLVIFGPLMIIIALAIKLFSPGPILYRQTRIGKDGKPFEMLKFRSMRLENAPDLHREYVSKLILENCAPESLGQKTLKLESDPRITGLGKVMRKLSIDELPQFFNVLRGEMSIVGPRPSLPYEYKLYKDWHKKRVLVLPGITGLWQVTARNKVRFDDMVKIDLDYIQNMTLLLDLRIILMTPYEMIRGKGGG